MDMPKAIRVWVPNFMDQNLKEDQRRNWRGNGGARAEMERETKRMRKRDRETG